MPPTTYQENTNREAAAEPNLFIVGAMKGGTTALHAALSQHSGIFMSAMKEPQFYMRRAHFYEHSLTADEYRALFEEAASFPVRGEASTWYLYDPDSASMIARQHPRAKIVAVLRHPADRAFSHYVYLRRDQRCPHDSFEEAVREEMGLLAKGDWIHPHPYLAMGFYARNLRRYYDQFPRDHIHIILYEDLKDAPEATLQKLQTFLEIPQQPLEVPAGVNRSGLPRSTWKHRLFNRPNKIRKLGKYLIPSSSARRKLIDRVNRKNLERPQLDPSLRAELVNYFSDDIRDLESLIDRNLADWRQFP